MAETYQVLQYVSIPLSFLFMLVCTLLPWKIKQYKNSATYMSIASCFGSGVILGAAFSHMAVHAMESFEKYFEAGHDHDEEHEGEEGHNHPYPWAMFIMILVLMALIAIDTIGNAAHDKMLGEKHDHDHAEGHPNHLVALFTDKPDSHAPAHVKIPVSPTVNTVKTETELVKTEPANKDQGQCGAPECDKKCNEESGASGGANTEVAVRGTRKQIIQAYVFFVALSLHAITDGMSIGTHEEAAGFYGILVAVIAHKALDGFALGVPLYHAKLPKFHTIFAILFCCLMTPLGIGIGLAAANSVSSENGELAKGICLSMSLGSFVFISLWEMLPAGLNHGKHFALKIFMTLLGWGIMAMLAIWV